MRFFYYKNVNRNERGGGGSNNSVTWQQVLTVKALSAHDFKQFEYLDNTTA